MKRPAQNQPKAKTRLEQLLEDREQLLKALENLQTPSTTKKPVKAK